MDEGFGLDRVSVSFPVSDYEREGAAWSTVTATAPGTPERVLRFGASVAIPSTDAACFVGIRDSKHQGVAWGKVEVNPSKVVGTAPRPCSSRELGSVVRSCIDAAGSLVTSSASVDEMRVKRLDVARDFEGVSDPALYVRGLASAHRPWARRSFVYSDPQRNLAETLFVGSGAGGCRLYDKHRESPETVPEGRVRWEAECRGAWLERYAGVRTVADVSDRAVVGLGWDRWRWSSMGAEVAAGEALIARVQASALTPAQQRAFLGWLLEEAFGAPGAAHRNTAGRYRRWARELGVAVSPALFRSEVAITGRLDYGDGSEVLRVAA